jgi:hypothetical protein
VFLSILLILHNTIFLEHLIKSIKKNLETEVEKDKAETTKEKRKEKPE